MLFTTFTGNVCNRCGKDLTTFVAMIGQDALDIHARMHTDSDFKEYIELAYVFARYLKEEGIIVEAHDMLKKLDPEMYERKMS